MATKAEVISHIKSTFVVSSENEHMMFLNFFGDDNRSQGVFVAVDDYKMMVNSVFATTEDITAEQAFKAAEENDTAFGIGRIGTLYVVKHLVQIADIDPSEVDGALRLTSAVADELEKELGLGDAH